MWLELQIFGFRALWSPYFFTFLLLIGIGYYLITCKYRKRFNEDAEIPVPKQQLMFYGGLLLIYIVKGAPLDLLSHIMLGAHMIQMALLYFVAPILLIRGLPEWVWRRIINFPVIRPLFRFFTLPLVALAVFNSLFPLYHVPLVFDYSKSSIVAHTIITVVLFIFAMTMWWPILSPVKELDKLEPLLKIGYLVISIFLVSIACALIIFANKPLYEAFSSSGAWVQSLSLCVPVDVLTGISGSLSGPEMFSPLSTIDDQQFGGIIMMTLQQIIYTSVISWVFFGWFTKKNMQIDPMPDNLPYQTTNNHK